MKRILAIAAGALLVTQAVSAQQRMVADKIAAIVGEKIILKSDIDGELMNMQREMNTLPPDASCTIMEQIIAQKVLVMQAERDSLPVSDADVDGQIDNRIRYFENIYGSREKMKEMTGYSVYQLRERFRTPIKEGLLAKAMSEKITGSVKVTPSEIKKFYDAIPKDSLQFYESELEIGQLIVIPKATYEMQQYAIQRLQEFKKEIENKTNDMSRLAILYSQDPAAKENKGVYILNRSEKTWDPDFMAAAFRLKEGEISSPVKSQFGYHLIMCLKRDGDNITVQHILLKPNITNSDLRDAQAKLDTIRTSILNNTYSFGVAVQKFSDDPSSKFTGGFIQNPTNGSNYITIDQLDDPNQRAIVLMLDTLKPGGLSAPVPYTDEQGQQGFRIVFLKSRSQPHRENLNDDYTRIQQRALAIKQQTARDKWLRDKIPTYYISVDDEYKQCGHISQWLGSVAKK
jgi:peptidyl-prolyl cis-trans isomerase SurA